MTRVIGIGPDDGELTLRTGVAGRAARTGHALTIGFDDWHGEVTFDDETPVAVSLRVDVESMQVRSGEGGLTPMTAPERLVARTNALKSLKSSKFGEIVFTADTVTAVDGGYRLAGSLTVCGTARPHTVEVTADGTTVSGESTVTQTDFGVKPYSLMMGALKVADDVVVALRATVAQ
ncbi:YceI family protein [Gordonia neofelifaecis]|uniref:YceI family protein n=1 Tax=Gordonia neofelifaecis NRRL B-59395 TaxID=644548 RepID=F1YFI1_9ACTN|nr:YceI family protein [Gordonia neofelifaecis]EGD56469.1 YceI family protein [Gordonia neofelifaecis NRRL B-59395]